MLLFINVYSSFPFKLRCDLSISQLRPLTICTYSPAQFSIRMIALSQDPDIPPMYMYGECIFTPKNADATIVFAQQIQTGRIASTLRSSVHPPSSLIDSQRETHNGEDR